MTRNVGSREWKVRALAGVLLLFAVLFYEWPDSWEWVPTAIAVALFATALTRYCPVNRLLGRSA